MGRNRLSAKEFCANDPSLGWDGFFDRKRMKPAVFVYRAEIEMVDGRNVQIKGDFYFNGLRVASYPLPVARYGQTTNWQQVTGNRKYSIFYLRRRYNDFGYLLFFVKNEKLT